MLIRFVVRITPHKTHKAWMEQPPHVKESLYNGECQGRGTTLHPNTMYFMHGKLLFGGHATTAKFTCTCATLTLPTHAVVTSLERTSLQSHHGVAKCLSCGTTLFVGRSSTDWSALSIMWRPSTPRLRDATGSWTSSASTPRLRDATRSWTSCARAMISNRGYV